MALSRAAIHAIANRRSLAKIDARRRPRRVTSDLAPLSALTHVPFMARGETRTHGVSTVRRLADRTVFSRNGSTGSSLDDLVCDFDQIFGQGAWHRFGGQGVIASINDVPCDDLTHLYALEYPNALVDGNVG